MTQLHPLARGVQHPSPLRHKAASWQVIAGLFAAPAAWWIQLLTSYALDGDRCLSSATAITAPLPQTTVAAVIGVVAIAGCVIGLFAAYGAWRRTRHEGPGEHYETLTAGIGRTRFLGLSGLIASTIFLVATLCEILVPVLVSPCGLRA